MDEEVLERFAKELGADPEQIIERWQGRPDLIIDDIFRVRDIDTGQARDLELFDVQRDMVHAYFYGDAATITAFKGRRIGYSFVVVACFLLEAMFYPESFYPLVSRSLSQSKDRITDIQRLIDDAKIDIPTVKTNTDYIELWNGSAFMAYSADSDTSRGADSARAVLMDEMAFMEDEESAQRAFRPFLALGSNRTMVEVSTPNTRNDVFMQHFRQGSPDGENGILSIKQSTFLNADEIDIDTPLTEQEIVPARPELNIQSIETERLQDPEGFGQEYLCRPVVDSYRFFDEASVEDAMSKANDPDYMYGFGTAKKGNVRRVMGVDIGINRDDTAISVMDHFPNGRREQVGLYVVDDELLRRAGVVDPDRGNPNHIAKLISFIRNQFGADAVIMDKGGPGEGFQRIVERKIGRALIPFDFSAKDDVSDMFGDTNMCLRERDMVLVPSDRLLDEMCSIVKEKRDHYSKPKFTGKDESESGKDDAAIATVLSAFPPKGGAATPTSPKGKEWDMEQEKQRAERASAGPSRKIPKEEASLRPGHGSTSVNRTSRKRRNKYNARNTRRR